MLWRMSILVIFGIRFREMHAGKYTARLKTKSQHFIDLVFKRCEFVMKSKIASTDKAGILDNVQVLSLLIAMVVTQLFRVRDG